MATRTMTHDNRVASRIEDGRSWSGRGYIARSAGVSVSVPLLASLLTVAMAREPAAYHGCRPERLAEDIVLHRCPGLMLTESPAPMVSAIVALKAARAQHESATITIKTLTMSVGDQPVPAFLVEGSTSNLMVAAAVVPGGQLRILQCAPSDRSESSVQRCGAMVARAVTLGLPSPGATPPKPTKPLLLGETVKPPTRPEARPSDGPTGDGPRFRGRAVPEPPDCHWAMLGEDLGALTCIDAALTIGRISVADPTVAIERLASPHTTAAKVGGFKGRVKRITGACTLDELPAMCVDLRLDPPNASAYRVLISAVQEHGSTWFASCQQQHVLPGIPAPCNRLIRDWPPPGVSD